MNAFNRLSQREKLLVLVALPLVALFAGYRFGWLPMTQARTEAEAEIASYRTVIEAVETTGDTRSQSPSQQAPTTPLPTRVTRSAEAAGVLVRRLEPEGDLVRVSLDDGQFEDIMAWIAVMEAQEAIALRSIEMDRRTAPGVVSTRLTLENAQ